MINLAFMVNERYIKAEADDRFEAALRNTEPDSIKDFLDYYYKNLQEFMEDIRKMNPDKREWFLDYRYKGCTNRSEFIGRLNKIIRFHILTDQQTIEVEKWLADNFAKIFGSSKFISDCEKMFIEVGIKDHTGKVVLTKGKGGPLFAVIDVLQRANAFVNPSNPSDTILLDWFNLYLGTEFKEIKRTTNNMNYKNYDAAINSLMDSFPGFIDYEKYFNKSLYR